MSFATDSGLKTMHFCASLTCNRLCTNLH